MIAKLQFIRRKGMMFRVYLILQIIISYVILVPASILIFYFVSKIIYVVIQIVLILNLIIGSSIIGGTLLKNLNQEDGEFFIIFIRKVSLYEKDLKFFNNSFIDNSLNFWDQYFCWCRYYCKCFVDYRTCNYGLS